MSEDRLLLWLDLETTGSSLEDGDEIIEIGCVLTDSELNYNKEFGDFSYVVNCSDSALVRLMRNPDVRHMHTDNGLLEQLLSRETEEIVNVENILVRNLKNIEHRSRN